MKSTKTNKRALLGSILALLLCCSLLIGTTFAWFTDTATSSVNRIQAGTLEIDMVGTDGVTLEGSSLVWEKAEGFADEEVLWEPGATYNLQKFKIVNNGSLALKFKLQVNGINGETKLLEVIEFTVASDNAADNLNAADLGTGLQAYEGHLPAGESTGFITITGHMLETAGNEYQGLSAEGIGITVYATQDSVEHDSIDNQYDAGAAYPVADAGEFTAAVAAAQAGDTVELVGDIVLDAPLNINEDIMIDGNGSAIISKEPVHVGANNDVTFKDITFTAPDNAKDTASSVYASGAEGKIVFDGCRFVDFQWEAIQITPKAGSEIIVNNCYFENTKTMAQTGIKTNRYLHIQKTDAAADPASITVTMTNNTFKNVVQSDVGGDGYFYDSAITIYGVAFDNITSTGNVFTGVVQADALTSLAVVWVGNDAAGAMNATELGGITVQ